MSSLYERRHEGRQRILTDVRCRIAPGQSPEVQLIEISVTGCQLGTKPGMLIVGQYIVVKAKGLEGLPGRVRWVLDEAAGVQFEQPLHPAVLDHLLTGGSPQAVYRAHESARPRPTGMPARSAAGFGRRSCL